MKLLLLSLVVFVTATAAVLFDGRNFATNGYIVELESSPSSLNRRSVLTPHQELYAQLDSLKINWSVRREYSHDVFVGAALTVVHPTATDTLSQMDVVKSIYPIALYERPNPTFSMAVGPTADDSAWPDLEPSHVMTGVDKLHAEGYTGKNITVGIIDTGIDYTNPYLGGCYGPGCKVAIGADYAGDAYNGNNDPMPTDDPKDCAGHGTHVAGIVAVDPKNPFNISGVAYEATLGAYRVFGCEGHTSDELIIDALLQADRDGCDVINISIGGPGGWTETASGVVGSRLAEKGRIVVVAAGNEGSYGGWYASSTSSGLDVIAVASVDSTGVSIQNLTVSDGYGPVPYGSAVPLNLTGSFPIYVVSTNTSVTDDACQSLPDDTPDLSTYVVLIKRGTCGISQKLQNAAKFNASNILVYNNRPGAALSGAYKGFNAVFIQQQDGEYLVKQFAGGMNVTVSFPQTGAGYYQEVPTGGLVSEFSTYGPTQDLYFKPAVAAPGGFILSTYPVAQGTFTILSGTSMASPFMAGSAALLLQAKGKTANGAVAVRSLFETTAMALPQSHNASSLLQTAAVQGAGLIDVYNAIHYSTVLTPGELLLNDTAYFNGNQSITITNSGSTNQTYTLAHIPVGTANTFSNGVAVPGPVPLDGSVAIDVDFSDFNFTLPPGSSKTAGVTFQPPQGFDSSKLPVYSGFIQVASDSGEILHATYLGAAAALKDVDILPQQMDTALGFNVTAVVDGQYPINGTSTFTFGLDHEPTILLKLAFGSPLVLVDLVSSSLIDSTYQQWKEWANSTSTIPTIGSIFMRQYMQRDNFEDARNRGVSAINWNGTFDNGTDAPNGEYKVLVRALRVTGDTGNAADYDYWLSPPFGVTRNDTVS